MQAHGPLHSAVELASPGRRRRGRIPRSPRVPYGVPAPAPIKFTTNLRLGHVSDRS
jgi:hypothetical protein